MLCWTSIFSSSSFDHHPPRTSMRILVDIIPWVLLPQLPSQNTVLDCLFLILLSTILHPWTIYFNQWRIQGPPLHLILRPNWGPKGRENFFLLEPHPSYLRVWVTVSLPYLKVWIRYWFQLPRLSFPYGPWIVHYYFWSFILPGLNGKMPGYAPGDFVTRAFKASGIYFFAP